MPKKILRMCQVTHEIKDRNNLFRIVKSSDQIIIDIDGSIKGRGAYLSKDKDVILLAKKKHILSKALRMNVNDSIYDDLISLL